MSESAQVQNKVGAVILAGGLARRMGGVDKGLVTLNGQPMVSIVLQTVLPCVSHCVVNANRNADEYRRLVPDGVSVIADHHPGHRGPLAGLSAALAVLPVQWVFMCPCDSPFLQTELIELLIRRAAKETSAERDADIVVAHDGQRMQPVFCVVHCSLQSSLDTFLDSGEGKIDRWFAMHRTVQVDAAAFRQSFKNINTEEERQQAEQML